MRTKQFLSDLMRLAWQFVRRNGYSMSEALKVAWANLKLKASLQKGIVKFYFQKVDGSTREAFGTLKQALIPTIAGADTRRRNDTVQTYFDTERGEWRCFKMANLVTYQLKSV